MGRTQTAAIYTILLATCAAGMVHAPWWAAIAGTCSLALVSLLTLRARVASAPGLRLINERILVLSSIMNATAAGFGVFAFGHLARWAWGV
jgi:hypothetical protein